MQSETQRLRDLCSLIVDCPHSTPVWTESGYIVIRNQNIKGGRLDLSSPSFTDAEHFAHRIRRAKPTAGDIIFTREAPMGEVCMVPPKLECCVGQRQVLLRPNPKVVDGRFLLYALQSPQVQHEISWSEGTGSTVSNVRIPVLEALRIPTPDLTTQQEIGVVLGMLDDRIDLLRQTNATLKSIAQALFKSWFIDFDPVRAKAEGREPEGMDAATAALFPAEFEESALGLIPKGWTAGVVSELASLRGGKQLDRSEFDDLGSNPIFGGAGEMGRTRLSNAEGFVLTVGRVGAYCGQFFWHVGQAWVNNNASVVRAHSSGDFYWLHQALLSSDIDRIKKGAAQPFVSNGDIEALPLLIPPARVRVAFREIAWSLYERQSRAVTQANSLRALRDTLLPRLISGKLRLPEASEQLGADLT